MALKFKFDVLSKLKEAGYTTYKFRQEKILSESTLQELRSGQMVKSTDKLERLCRLLNCQPGDLIEFVDDTLPEKTNASD